MNAELGAEKVATTPIDRIMWLGHQLDFFGYLLLLLEPFENSFDQDLPIFLPFQTDYLAVSACFCHHEPACIQSL